MYTSARLFHLPHHKSEFLSLLYVIATLRTFVFLLLGLFLPVFLFQTAIEGGFDEKSSLMLVAFTFLAMQVTDGFMLTLVSRINARYGIKTGLIIAQLLMVLFLAILFSRQDYLSVFLNFLVWGVAASFYWVSYHVFFLEVAKKRTFGEELGFLEVVGLCLGLIAPLLAGMIVGAFGFTPLFSFCLVFIVLSVVLLFFVKDQERTKPVTFSAVTTEIIKRKRDFVSFIGAGAEEIVYTVAWPLLLFTVFRSYIQVGIIGSLTVLTAVIAAIVAGKLSDRITKDRVERIGALGVFASSILRVFFQSPISLYLIDSIYKVLSRFFYIPLNALAYVHAAKENKARYVVFREVGYRCGNALGLTCFLVITTAGFPFWWTFLFAALFALLPLFAREKEVQ